MANVISVKNLKKVYPTFTLDNVSFEVGAGRITGFIGRNGAGKSTTLKGMLNLINTEGDIRYFGRDFRTEESALKSKIGYVGGGFGTYKTCTLKKIASVVASFYDDWEEDTFRDYCAEFGLDVAKKVSALSEGMKVKFALALALSHGAEILILDEPTSGLDPISREEFSDVMISLRKRGVTILFSTHITSDIMRIADDILYISGGRILANEPLSSFLNRYRLVTFPTLRDAEAYGGKVVGLKEVKDGYEGLIENGSECGDVATSDVDLDIIMVHLEEELKNAR